MFDWDELEAVIRRDPGGRGLASFNDGGVPLLSGGLRAAALDLAEARGPAVIVTGFAIRKAGHDHWRKPNAETDGPPGSIFLAAMLDRCGITATLATDQVGAPVLKEGLDEVALGDVLLVVAPSIENDAAGRRLLNNWRRSLSAKDVTPSYLIAIERVGPSHTLDSVESASRAEFEQLVPPAERDVCHNMRGVSLDDVTAPFHVLFESNEPQDGPMPTTIGILDGGNEIGSGNIPWNVLRRAIAQGAASKDYAAVLPCRIRTDHAIVAGVSNWGAYALGAAVAVLRGRRDAVENWTAEYQCKLIHAMVEQGGAVDGVTKRREATVDGLAMSDYLGVFEEIRRIVLR